MKAVWIWSVGSCLAVAAVVLWTIGLKAWAGGNPGQSEPAVLFSQAGRDRAFTQGVLAARKSLYLRTASLALVPFTNELGQAAQRGVHVHVEIPMQAAQGQNASSCITFLAQVGAWLEIGNRPASAYEGCYLLIDDRVFYYSAGSLEYSEPGVPHSYVRGKKG